MRVKHMVLNLRTPEELIQAASQEMASMRTLAAVEAPVQLKITTLTVHSRVVSVAGEEQVSQAREGIRDDTQR